MSDEITVSDSSKWVALTANAAWIKLEEMPEEMKDGRVVTFSSKRGVIGNMEQYKYDKNIKGWVKDMAQDSLVRAYSITDYDMKKMDMYFLNIEIPPLKA